SALDRSAARARFDPTRPAPSREENERPTMSNTKTHDPGSRSAPAKQQHDDSALFSLRNLARQGAPPPKERAVPSGDESGLIDLRALMAMHEQHAERPKLDVAPFVGVGLFDVPEKAPEPLPPPVEQAPARAPRWRTIALLAGAVTTVAAVSAIVIA